MTGLLHVICASVRSDASLRERSAARDLAALLFEAPGVRCVVVGESPSHLLIATWLDGRDALDAFVASPAHMAFIMRGVALITSGMWSAAVETDAQPPREADALLIFGLRAVEGAPMYEWQVRALLDALEMPPVACAAGPTFEERDRFRAAGAITAAKADVTVLASLADLEAVRALGSAFVASIAPVVAAQITS